MPNAASEAGAAVIDVRDLVYDYATSRALSGVSLTIEPGTITGLVGPNGAGKTTLLRCVAALETPFSGSVAVDGMKTTEHPPRDPPADRLLAGFLRPFMTN